MPEYLSALAHILVLATAVFMFAKAPVCAVASTAGDFERRRNLWIGITLTAFLAHNFWLMLVLAAWMMLLALPHEPNKLAMYFFLLFAVPPISDDITGLGIINHFFKIDYLRLISLTVLLPAFLELLKRSDVDRFGRLLPDKLIAGYLVLQFVLMLKASTFTDVLRQGAFYQFIDIFLPYYVASRALKDVRGFRDALTAFVIAGLVLAAIAIVEFSKHWLLYYSLSNVLGVALKSGNYFSRGDDLRAVGSARQPVPLGYILAVAMGLSLYLSKLIPKRIWRLGFALLIGGLIGAMSRGPWVGAVAMLIVFIALGPDPLKRFAKFGLLGVIVIPLLLASPLGGKIIANMPFIGTLDVDNVTYRQDFTAISIAFILNHPLFGAYDYVYAPEMQVLRIGGGILDTLNVFLTVGLGSGLTGMFLFGGVFVYAGVGVFKGMRNLADRNSELYLLGQTLLATLLGSIAILCTISGISQIPLVYWTLNGMCIAYARMLARATVPAKTAATAKPAHFQPVVITNEPATGG